MNIYLEFGASMAWAQMVALAFRYLIWDDMDLPTTAIGGLMGGIAGWIFGITSADHLTWFVALSYGYRLLVIAALVVVFVAGFQRLLSKQAA